MRFIAILTYLNLHICDIKYLNSILPLEHREKKMSKDTDLRSKILLRKRSILPQSILPRSTKSPLQKAPCPRYAEKSDVSCAFSSFFCNPIDLRFPAKLQKIIHCQDIQLQVHSWRLREAELANRTSNSSAFYSFSVVLFDRESSWSDRYEALTSFSQSRINLYLDLP